jgi:hypothetical protein
VLMGHRLTNHSVRIFIKSAVPKVAANRALFDFQRADFRRQEVQAEAREEPDSPPNRYP